MPVFNPQHHTAELQRALQGLDGLIVACYCAAWCDSCKKYQPDFNALAKQHAQHVFVWIDIEEHPEWLGDEDVENFPTLLIQGPQGNLFFGPLQPNISHLARLLSSLDSESPPVLGGPPSLLALAATT